MLQLALHILDIVENSTRAGATLVTVVITEDRKEDLFRIEISDDGRGMSGEARRKALDPFYTTKGVRRVGLGLPMLFQATRQGGGQFAIESKEGAGTSVCAEFKHGHIDRQPLGDMAGTMTTLVAGNPEINFVYIHRNEDQVFTFDTREIKAQIDDVPINHPDILKFIRTSIEDGLEEVGVKYE